MDLTRISIDGGTQTRAALNEPVVAEYADALRDGVKLPAVVVFFDGSAHWLADGFHRYFAHKAARKASINVDVREGTQRDAVLFSTGCNSTHGLRRSNEDKRRAVMTLLNDSEWRSWSDREIAKQCDVSHTFVANLRAPKVATLPPAPPAAEPAESGNVATEAAEEKPAHEAANDYQPEEEDPVSILAAENDQLRARLAVGLMDGTDEEKQEAADTIDDLRQQVKTLTAENAALRVSRDHYQSEASQLRKQIQMNAKELKRARAA